MRVPFSALQPLGGLVEGMSWSQEKTPAAGAVSGTTLRRDRCKVPLPGDPPLPGQLPRRRPLPPTASAGVLFLPPTMTTETHGLDPAEKQT